MCRDNALAAGLPGQALPHFLDVWGSFRLGRRSAQLGFSGVATEKPLLDPCSPRSSAVSALTARPLIHFTLSSVQVWAESDATLARGRPGVPSLLAVKAVPPRKGLGRLWNQLPRAGLISGLTCTRLRLRGPEVRVRLELCSYWAPCIST